MLMPKHANMFICMGVQMPLIEYAQKILNKHCKKMCQAFLKRNLAHA